MLAGCTTPAAQEVSFAERLRVDQVPEGARLSWDETPRGIASSFVVYRDGAKLATVKSPLRTYLDETVAHDREYAYRVSAVMPNGTETRATEEETFTYRLSLALIQDARVDRGFVNLSVLQVSPGLEWADLTVLVKGSPIARSEDAYRERGEAWTHTAPRDPLTDLGERLQIHAPGKVVRNATLEVRLADGTVLLQQFLEGRPTLNLTLRQERNATEGGVSFSVQKIRWFDGSRDVTTEHSGLTPLWTDLGVVVDGARLPYVTDNRPESWTQDSPGDNVIRIGDRLIMRSSLVKAGATVVFMDASATQESFRRTLS